MKPEIEQKIVAALVRVMDQMRELAAGMTKVVGYDCGFNATIEVTEGNIYPHLRLLDNGGEYECVCVRAMPEEGPNYDIWKHGRLLHLGFDREQAADFMLKAYLKAKLRRVEERRAGKNNN